VLDGRLPWESALWIVVLRTSAPYDGFLAKASFEIKFEFPLKEDLAIFPAARGPPVDSLIYTMNQNSPESAAGF
jgi:hypothetical protein